MSDALANEEPLASEFDPVPAEASPLQDDVMDQDEDEQSEWGPDRWYGSHAGEAPATAVLRGFLGFSESRGISSGYPVFIRGMNDTVTPTGGNEMGQAFEGHSTITTGISNDPIQIVGVNRC